MDKELFKSFRKEYTLGELSEDTVQSNPFSQFREWFDQMLQTDVPEPNAMTLATSDKNGYVTARVVLLKDISENGLIFYTNYLSLKGRQMDENPQAAILFYWGELQRQVRIEGPLERLDPDLSRAYFQSRPFESRLGAVASAQSSEIADRAVLEEQLAELREKYANQDVPMPDHWGGIRLIPNYFEFWQGRKSRLHDRIYYRLATDSWKIGRLSP